MGIFDFRGRGDSKFDTMQFLSADGGTIGRAPVIPASDRIAVLHFGTQLATSISALHLCLHHYHDCLMRMERYTPETARAWIAGMEGLNNALRQLDGVALNFWRAGGDGDLETSSPANLLFISRCITDSITILEGAKGVGDEGTPLIPAHFGALNHFLYAHHNCRLWLRQLRSVNADLDLSATNFEFPPGNSDVSIGLRQAFTQALNSARPDAEEPVFTNNLRNAFLFSQVAAVVDPYDYFNAIYPPLVAGCDKLSENNSLDGASLRLLEQVRQNSRDLSPREYWRTAWASISTAAV